MKTTYASIVPFKSKLNSLSVLITNKSFANTVLYSSKIFNVPFSVTGNVNISAQYISSASPLFNSITFNFVALTLARWIFEDEPKDGHFSVMTGLTMSQFDMLTFIPPFTERLCHQCAISSSMTYHQIRKGGV